MEISKGTQLEISLLLQRVAELEKAYTAYNQAEPYSTQKIERRLDLASAIGLVVYRARGLKNNFEHDEKHQTVSAEEYAIRNRFAPAE